MIVAIKHIPFVSAPGMVRADKFIDGVPGLLVVGRRCQVLWRVSHHLPPEKTRELRALGSGYVAVGDENVRMAIMIKVPGIRGPGPAAELEVRLASGIAKFPVS